MKILNLKKSLKYLNDYIRLRNKYHKILLTEITDLNSTRNWLGNYNVEVLIAVENDSILGACIIHVYKKGELTIFVGNKNKGIGSALFSEAENIAKKNKLDKIWAWTDKYNIEANKFLLRQGFIKKGIKKREYKGKKLTGNLFEKKYE